MKKFVTLSVLGATLALAACAGNGTADYGYEKSAPYGDERTVGKDDMPVVKKADTVFKSGQSK